jgi:asparagine synthetase B (glutamine-hydrolysing)
LKDKISRYLKYGDSFLFDYGSCVDIENFPWSDAKDTFQRKFKKSLEISYRDNLAFCGTLSACTIAKMVNPKNTWSVYLGHDVRRLAEKLGSNHIYAKLDLLDLEKLLFQINEIFDEPRSTLEDIYIFTRQKEMKRQGIKEIYCEGGSDWLLLGYEKMFSDVINLSMRRKEYSIVKASKYGKGKSFKTEKPPKTYSDAFFKNNRILPEDKIIELGVEPSGFGLRKDNLQHLIRLAFDWSKQILYKRRAGKFADYFGIDIYSPYYDNEEFINFCLSLPVEMKFCLGRGKHILKESINLSQESKELIIPKLSSMIYKYIRPEAERLIDKYLRDKNSIIFNYLPFDKVQNLLDNYVYAWHLLNLQIWLELHE